MHILLCRRTSHGVVYGGANYISKVLPVCQNALGLINGAARGRKTQKR